MIGYNYSEISRHIFRIIRKRFHVSIVSVVLRLRHRVGSSLPLFPPPTEPTVSPLLAHLVSLLIDKINSPTRRLV